MCELLSKRLAATGAVHPVAGAVALAARGHLGMSRDEFAELNGLDSCLVAAAEEGRVPFGRLPSEIDWVLDDIKGLDLLSLADAARATRCGTAAVSCQHEQPCSDA